MIRTWLIRFFELPPRVGESSGEGFKKVILKVCFEPRMLGLFLVFLLFIVGGWFFLIQPALDKVTVLDKTLFIERQTLSHKKKAFITIQNQLVETVYFPVRFPKRFNNQPLDQSALKIIRQISLSRLNLPTPIQKRPVKTETLDRLPFSHAPVRLSRHPFQLILTGSYSDLAHVVHQVAQSEELMAIDGVSITPLKERTPKRPPMLKMVLNISIYFLLP